MYLETMPKYRYRLEYGDGKTWQLYVEQFTRKAVLHAFDGMPDGVTKQFDWRIAKYKTDIVDVQELSCKDE